MTAPLTLDGVGSYTPTDDADLARWNTLAAFLREEPRAFSRDPHIGAHVTASALVLSPDLSAALLTHHRKLGLWLQLGGHCDGIADAPFVALKEAYEESGLPRIDMMTADVLDVDCLPVPAFGADPAHMHHDVRYLMQARTLDFAVSEESHALAWVPLSEFESVTTEATMLRLRDRALAYLSAT